ncbi:hypothetical protein GALMADRAFT_159120 [Galerina marginata CBS 339.88]|uniref:Uncharacterized protein n=1 Tax=Galerina marginata (strain CBS 339.88) TaxID=685588 RepID=A0A067SPY5_GALM3|nr:hypothetical protein GALMADRAFT_159120 [Galerina marginata CBS 339.88]
MTDDYNDQVSSIKAHFEKLFAHPPAELSSTIRASPLGACSEALATSLLSAAQANPISIDTLVQPLVRELSATEDLRFTDEDAGYTNIQFNTVFRIDLADILSDSLHEIQPKPKQTDILPSNTVLSSALFSASAIRNNLLSSTAIYAFVEKGLQFPGTTTETERQEVMAIGTCLLLLVAGRVLLDKWMADEDRLETVIEALEGLKKKAVIQYPTAVSLLERTVVAAGDGFVTIIPAADAWKLLFP